MTIILTFNTVYKRKTVDNLSNVIAFYFQKKHFLIQYSAKVDKIPLDVIKNFAIYDYD